MTEQQEKESYRIMFNLVKNQIISLLNKEGEFHFGDMVDVEQRVSLLRHLLPHSLISSNIQFSYEQADGKKCL